MTDRAAHSVPLFEGRSSRRHQLRSLDDLRADAAAYSGSGSAPDLAGVRTLVQFAGFPRSGHSLVGSLIDAHPDAVVAHELDLMGLLEHGLDRSEIFSLVCANSAEFERNERCWNGFSYQIPAAAGGTSPRPVVLGDKKADWAVRRVREDPSLLTRLADLLDGVRASWIVVLRNPFDNVATMSLRKGRAYDRIRIRSATDDDFRRRLERAQGDRVPAHVLPEMVEDYATLCEGVAAMKERVPTGDWLEVRHEDLVARPAETLERLLAFLELPSAPRLVSSASAAVSPEVNRSRHQVHWTAEARDRVGQLVADHSFLRGYRFDDE